MRNVGSNRTKDGHSEISGWSIRNLASLERWSAKGGEFKHSSADFDASVCCRNDAESEPDVLRFLKMRTNGRPGGGQRTYEVWSYS